jgi:hypothetical protein
MSVTIPEIGRRIGSSTAHNPTNPSQVQLNAETSTTQNSPGPSHTVPSPKIALTVPRSGAGSKMIRNAAPLTKADTANGTISAGCRNDHSALSR